MISAPSHTSSKRPLLRLGHLLCCLGIAFCILSNSAKAADYNEAQRLLFTGKYAECMKVAKAEVDRGVWNENWSQMLLRCQLLTGKYDEAVPLYEAAIARFSNSIGLRMIGHEIYNYVGRPEKAKQQYLEIEALVEKSPWRYSSSKDRVVLGRFLIARGEDARDVLKLFYDRAKKSNNRFAEAHIASAELALSKHDYQEAANSVEKALELEPDNPQVHFLHAEAWNSDQEKVANSISKALELNPKHIPSLLFQSDNLIDGEKYAGAEKLLDEVLQVNPNQPQAWAYRAVIAHLRGQPEKEKQHRERALGKWKNNASVDHLIGKKLSRNYRFAEGAKYQRLALKSDPNLLAVKFQLSQDLLRTGDEELGWRLAKEVHDTDEYNVVAYNTVTLQNELSKFETLESKHFLLRMDAREAKIYGQQALEFLEEAHDVFVAKYDAELEYPTIVEIFPKQRDFAIRTFGLPGGAGYLGVCFGRVVTANSPASQGATPANWQSVLWHEFCHVVTLTKTNNKMPRWLSEGISTYEEQERNDSWGERLSPQYQVFIADGALTPVSQLSSAFLNPKSPMHLQFAYCESSLVVRFLIEKHGIQTLKRVLTDLGVGMPINESLERYVGSIEKLDNDFEAYAKEYAKKVAPEMDWEWKEEWDELEPAEFVEKLRDHPKNYHLLTRGAAVAIKAKRFDAAEKALLDLKKLYPDDRQPNGSLALLARLYKEKGDEEKELAVLDEFARINDRALDSYQRLAETHLKSKRWNEARENALRYLSVQPMNSVGHELLAKAAEPLGKPEDVAASLAALLQMNPVDPAEAHFRLAKALDKSGDRESAKRQVLMALEQAPRYRDAQQFLLKVLEQNDPVGEEQVSTERDL